MKIAALIIWIIVGLLNLIFVKDVDKLIYGLTWAVLIINLIDDLVKQGGD